MHTATTVLLMVDRSDGAEQQLSLDQPFCGKRYPPGNGNQGERLSA